MPLHGRNLIIKANGAVIAGAKSCTINIKADTIETSSPQQGQWKEYIAGRKGWSVDTSFLLPYNNGEIVHRMRFAVKDGRFMVNGSPTGTVTHICIWKGGVLADNIPQSNYSILGVRLTHDYLGQYLAVFVDATNESYHSDILTMCNGLFSTTFSNDTKYILAIGEAGGTEWRIVSTSATDTEELRVVLGQDWKPATSVLLSTAQMVGTSVTLIAENTDTGEILTGSAICTSWKITATLGNLVQGSFAFQGTSQLTPVSP